MAPSEPSATHVGYMATGGPAKTVRLNPAGMVTWERTFASSAGVIVTTPLFGIGAGRAVTAGGGVAKYCACAGRLPASVAATPTIAREVPIEIRFMDRDAVCGGDRRYSPSAQRKPWRSSF